MKSVNNAKHIITETLKKAKKDIQEIAPLIDSNQAAIDELNQKMEEASKAFDMEKYCQLKNERQNFVDSVEMYKNRLASIRNKPLISKEEYTRLTEEIISEYDAIESDAKKQLFSLAEEMKTIADKVAEELDSANEALKKLQNDLYRNADRKKNVIGVYCANDVKEIRKNDAIIWGRAAYNHPIRNEFTSTKPGHYSGH